MHWLIAASAHDTATVRARFSELEQQRSKVLKLDEFMERKAAEKRAREEAR